MDERTANKMCGQSDVILQCINKNFISLQDEERKVCVDHFKQVLEKLYIEMKKQDTLFAAIFERECGAGSYFDGLRVAKANEFDMDLVMRLPINYNEAIIENDGVPPAFVKVKITKALNILRQHPRWTSDYRGLDNWRDSDGYLLQTKVRTWMEGVVTKTLNTLPKVDANRSELVITRKESDGSEVDVKYTISFKKSGPAMTLNISLPGDLPNVDVDLVPVIEFKHPQWPPEPVELPDPVILSKRSAWFIVPKPKKQPCEDYFWRLAFHDQEREMLHEKHNLKPVCRLLKKFRDTRNMSLIASYYIKTLFLREVHENRDPEFWRKSLTKLFLYMLQKLQESLKDGHIYYFWDNRYNLLEAMTPVQLENYYGNLTRVLNVMKKKLFEAEKGCEDPNVLTEYLLTKSERDKFSTMQTNVGVAERSPSRLLGSSLCNGLGSSLHNVVQNVRKDETDNQGSLLEDMKNVMRQMQKTILQTNEMVVQVLERVEKLENKIDSQYTNVMHLDDKLKLLQQNGLPLAED